MKRKNATRNALFTSIISLLLCVSMLVGTTFAWFTDSVESGVNNIVAGNLDIELEYSKDASSWKPVSSATDLFSGALWEPGHTEVVYLRLSNKGTLALNYQLGINVDSETEGTNVAGTTFKLSDYIQFGVVEGQNTKFADRAAAVAAVNGSSKKLNEGYTKASSMVAGAADAYLALVVYMPESVGNEANYRGTTAPTIDLGINVVATQKTQETDSFGNDYDALAQGGNTSGDAPAAGEYKEYTVMSGTEGNVKAATMLIHSDSVEDTTKPIEISIVPTTLNANVTVDTTTQEANTYDITVSNLKENNTTAIKVELNIGTGLTGVEVYHNETKIESSYNATTGYVTFETTSFSPYTVVYDAVATEDEPTDTELPTATVTEAPEFVGTEIAWGSSFGNAQAEQQLEAAYIFTTPHTSTSVDESEYKNWFCDFYVSVDRDVPEGAIFLGGNYGSFGWLGFDNTGLPVTAGQEIPLLGTAISGSTDGTTNWTYEQIVDLVAEFKCGVARTYGSDMNTLAGATFTVKLCLINPETNERTAVNTVNYTFAEAEEDNSVTDAAGLKAALAAGETEIEIKGTITLTEGLNASNVTLIGASEDAGINFAGHNIIGSGSITYKGLNLTTVSLPYADGANGERYDWYGGIDYKGHSVANYENCTITGVFTTYSGTVNATGCTFNSYVQDGEEFYNIFMYGNGTVNATNCTFMYRDRAIKIYSEGANTYTLNINGGKFVATSDYTVNKPLINVDSTYFTSATINVNGVTIDENLASASLHNAEGNSKVTVTVE